MADIQQKAARKLNWMARPSAVQRPGWRPGSERPPRMARSSSWYATNSAATVTIFIQPAAHMVTRYYWCYCGTAQLHCNH